MAEQTFIKGKDRDLESTISSMEAKLFDLGFEVEQASWLNPINGVYSVHIRDKQCPALFTNGKGSSKKACLASALGEFFERLSCNYFFADYYLGQQQDRHGFVHYPDERWFDGFDNPRPEGLLNEELWQYFDPDGVLSAAELFDSNSGAGERGVCAVPFQRLSNGETVYFPVNIIGNIFVSNGMSAGNSRNEARVQALSEVFERYVKNKIISEGLCLPVIPEVVLSRFPMIQTMLSELRDYGYQLKVADASLGGQYPVINVTLINQQHGSVFASFGAHPCFEVALERTVTELLQGRRLDQMDVFHPPTFDIDEVRSPQNLEMHFIDSSGYVSQDFLRQQADFEFVDWDHDGNTGDEFAYLSQLVQQHGFEIYIADYQHLGVYSCRVLVPGMSDIYPVDELQWENNNEGAGFREEMLALTSLNDRDWQELSDKLEEGGYHDQTPLAQFVGLLPDPDTLWSTLRLGELKAMLFLALQDEAALDWVDWCLSLGNDENYTRYYRCIKTVLEIKWDEQRHLADYKQGLVMLYGRQLVDDAIAISEGRLVFHQLHCPGISLRGFNLHNKLLDAYDKLQKAKKV